MTITLNIGPEIEAELARQAAAHGLAIGAYAASLLEEAARLPKSTATIREPKDMVELFAPLQGLNIDFERDTDPGREINL